MRAGAFRIALIYLTISLAWIAFSDRMLIIYQHLLSPHWFDVLSNSRRFVFIIVTSYLIYRLVKAHEKKFIEKELQARRIDNEVKRLGGIITKVNNIIIITNQNNFITWVNKAFEDFTGYKLEEVAGYAPSTFFVGEETDLDILTDILDKKKAHESFSADVRCHSKQGNKFWVYGEYTPFFEGDDEFVGYIAVYNDITRIKQKEYEITKQNDKLKEVAWISSHGVRRPLANIIGLANMMKDSLTMDEKIKILENINKSAGELDQMIHTINSTIETELSLIELPLRKP